MLLNPYRFTVAAPYTGIDMDDYSGDTPVGIYSMRRINSSYSGALIRLRRSSDNVESDFGSGLSMGEFLDSSAITTWLSGANAFVAIWYDQSGEGHNLRQTTAASQPQLVTTGVGATTYSIYFDGVNDHLGGASTFELMNGPSMTAYHCIQAIDTGFSTLSSLTISEFSSSNTVYMRLNRYGNNTRMSWDGQWLNNTSYTAVDLVHYLAYHTGTTVGIDLNDGGYAISTGNTSTKSGVNGIHIGGDYTSHPWEGHYYEFLLFKDYQGTSTIDTIRDDQNTAYTLF